MFRDKSILIFKRLSLTIVVFLIAQLFLLAVLSFTNSRYPDPSTWAHWDSGHYLKIAENGYEYFSCAGLFGYPEDTKEMCGNCGWFPAYPFLIKTFGYLFQDKKLISGIISKVFCFFILFMVLVIADIRKFTFRNLLFLSIAGFFFGFVYYSAVFPISAVLFLALAAIYFYFKRNICISGLFCMLASLFYPTAILISFAIATTIFFRDQAIPVKKRIQKCIIPISMGITGLLIVFLIFQLQVGEWDAFMKVQSKYGHGIQNPIKKAAGVIEKFNAEIFSADNFSNLQSISVLAGFLILTRAFIRKKLYQNELYLLSYCYVAFYLISPWTLGGNISLYRAESLLLPAVFLLKDLKTKWILLIVLILLAIGGPMSYFFFEGNLI